MGPLADAETVAISKGLLTLCPIYFAALPITPAPLKATLTVTKAKAPSATLNQSAARRPARNAGLPKLSAPVTAKLADRS